MFSVFVPNKIALDKAIWNAWLAGLTVCTPLQVDSYVTGQYRQFEMLETFLFNPKLLKTQLLFPMPFDTMQYLIGKKLTHRVRKDLDDVSHRTLVPIMGCRRMFDNLKRIIKRVDDFEGPTIDTIMSQFLLPRELASRYAHIMFINQHRLDTSKKKLANVNFSDFEYGSFFHLVASIFVQYFAVSSATPDDIDTNLAQDARDLKTILFNHKETIEPFKESISQALVIMGSANIVESGGINAYRIVLRNILMIGAGLANGKEFRDIFSLIVEKVLEPSASFGWTASDLDTFLSCITTVFTESQQPGLHANIQKRFKDSFRRLMEAIRLSAVRLYRCNSSK